MATEVGTAATVRPKLWVEIREDGRAALENRDTFDRWFYVQAYERPKMYEDRKSYTPGTLILKVLTQREWDGKAKKFVNHPAYYVAMSIDTEEEQWQYEEPDTENLMSTIKGKGVRLRGYILVEWPARMRHE